MSDEPKRDLNSMINDMGESVSKLAKHLISLASSGAEKAQEAIEDYKSNGKAAEAKPKAEKVAESEEKPVEPSVEKPVEPVAEEASKDAE